MKKITNTSLGKIPELARNTALGLKGGEIFGLFGQLGAGKTTFVKAVGKELKVRQRITSPTFNLLNSYPVKLKNKNILLYHLDLYRTGGYLEAKNLGLCEFWGKKHTITFIEWADKIKKYLPAKTQIIKFINK